jgi:hypothetical protein
VRIAHLLVGRYLCGFLIHQLRIVPQIRNPSCGYYALHSAFSLAERLASRYNASGQHVSLQRAKYD